MGRLPLHWEVSYRRIGKKYYIQIIRLPLHTAHLQLPSDRLSLLSSKYFFSCPKISIVCSRIAFSFQDFRKHVACISRQKWEQQELVGIWCILPSSNRCHLWLDINVPSNMYSWRLAFLDTCSGGKIQSIIKKNTYKDIMQVLNCINRRLKRWIKVTSDRTPDVGWCRL
jgi:hypothetical protein